MKLEDFTADELSQLENLQILGGSASPMGSNLECTHRSCSNGFCANPDCTQADCKPKISITKCSFGTCSFTTCSLIEPQTSDCNCTVLID